ncbi:MAG: hypothetical protein ACTSU5_13640 [Promethearchaeota archaeon]
MENKLGFGAGVLALLVCFLREVPLGIYFSGGATATVGISMDLVRGDGVPAYAWGRGTELWTETGPMGPYALLLFLVVPVVAALVALYAAFEEGPRGKHLFVASTVLLAAALAVMVLDAYYLHALAFGSAVAVSFGPGFWLFDAALSLSFAAISAHPVEETI